MRRVLLFNSITNFDWVRAFTAHMRIAFIENGCECAVIDSALPVINSFHDYVDDYKPDFLFGFNAAGMNLLNIEDGKLPGPQMPYFNFLVDDPMFQRHWLEFLRSNHVYNGLCDPTHKRSAQILGIAPTNVSEVRLGGHPSPRVRDDARTHDIVFTGSVADPEAIRKHWRGYMADKQYMVTTEVAERWGENLECSLQDVFDSVVSEHKFELTPDNRFNLQLAVSSDVNRLIRNRERLRILTHLKDMPITIFGEGWEPSLIPGAKFKFGPSLSFNQSHEELCRSKILLNAQPIAIFATGERALGGLLNGVALVTTRNYYLSEHFEEGDEFSSFSSAATDMDGVRDTLEDLLANPGKREEMAEKGRDKALAGHTWRHRAADVLATMDCIERPPATQSLAGKLAHGLL